MFAITQASARIVLHSGVVLLMLIALDWSEPGAARALEGCADSCGGRSPDGCYCDEACTGYGDCCEDYVSECTDSCIGHCGGFEGSCYCDDLCTGYGDCCFDYVPECRRRVERISAGGRQTCAVMEDGGVVCWGLGQYGVLGYGGTANVPTPDSAPGDVDVGAPVSRIAAGYYHTCALLSGAVKCWGRNSDGQLGYPGAGDVGDDEVPAAMPNVNVGGSVTQLVAGTYHTCALLSGGTVKCWGSNMFGQLGYPGVSSVTDPSTAGAVNVGGTVTAIYGGGFHTCARLSAGGALRCWGDNSLGQLGYGVSTGSRMHVGDDETPASVGNVPVGASWTELGAGSASTCARLAAGGVRCWGDGGSVLGDGSGLTYGDDEPASAAPVLRSGELLSAVASGGSHRCVLTTLGRVRCWGYIPLAGIGYGSPAAVMTAAAAGLVDVGWTVSSIAAGYSHVCAVLENGGARCWGQSGLHGYPMSGGIGDDETPADMGDIFFP